MNDDGIGPKMTTNLTRHSNYATVSHYERSSQAAIDQCIDTLQGACGANDPITPFLDDDDDKKPAAASRPSMQALQDSTNTQVLTALALYQMLEKKKPPVADITDVFGDLASGSNNENCPPSGGFPYNPNVVPPSTNQIVKKIRTEDVSVLPRPRLLSYHEASTSHACGPSPPVATTYLPSVPPPASFWGYAHGQQQFSGPYVEYPTHTGATAAPRHVLMPPDHHYQPFSGAPRMMEVFPQPQPMRRYYIEESAPAPPAPPTGRRIYVEEPPQQPQFYQGNGAHQLNQGCRFYYEE